MDRDAASRVRQRLCTLREERRRIEERLLEPTRLLRGSWVERYGIVGGYQRRTPAFYVSAPSQDGRKRLFYVRKKELQRVRREVEAYREYRKALSRLDALDREILEAYRFLAKSQEVGLGS